MKYLYIVDAKTKIPVEINPIVINGPYQIVFCKDRKTKKRYVMVREENSDPFDFSKRQLFETKYCQYDNILVQIK